MGGEGVGQEGRTGGRGWGWRKGEGWQWRGGLLKRKTDNGSCLTLTTIPLRTLDSHRYPPPHTPPDCLLTVDTASGFTPSQ